MESLDPLFDNWKSEKLEEQSTNSKFVALSKEWREESVNTQYSYQFTWLGVPIIQYPSDLVVFQEIVWKVRPTLIIECGVARGGSMIFWASMQEIAGIKPNVIGVDIDIRNHARVAIDGSRYAQDIDLIEADSTANETHKTLAARINPQDIVLIILDSNHTHDHVLAELYGYANYVSKNSYLLVLDTVIEDLPIDKSRNWGPGNSPKSAVKEFMERNGDFVIDTSYEQRAVFTVAPNGFLLRK